MKLLIAGSRTFDSREIPFIIQYAMNISGFETPVEIVSGGAKGVDLGGEKWAEIMNDERCKENQILVTRFIPDWKAHGKSAGFLRNKEMVDYSDCAIIIWNGKSNGTKHTIDLLKESGKPHIIITMEETLYGSFIKLLPESRTNT